MNASIGFGLLALVSGVPFFVILVVAVRSDRRNRRRFRGGEGWNADSRSSAPTGSDYSGVDGGIARDRSAHGGTWTNL